MYYYCWCLFAGSLLSFCFHNLPYLLFFVGCVFLKGQQHSLKRLHRAGGSRLCNQPTILAHRSKSMLKALHNLLTKKKALHNLGRRWPKKNLGRREYVPGKIFCIGEFCFPPRKIIEQFFTLKCKVKYVGNLERIWFLWSDDVHFNCV